MQRNVAAKESRLNVQVINCQKIVPIDRRLVRRAVRTAAKGFFAGQAIDVVFVDDATIRQVNRRFLGRDRVTDVIAFDYREQGPHTGATAEIIVSAERARVEARWRRLPLERELLLYVIHGVLHLLGYDDQTVPQRRRMRSREREILSALWPQSQESRGLRQAR